MKDAALYELADMRDVLSDWLDETEGELTPMLDEILTELSGKIDEKIERVALFIREQVATAKAIGEEADRLTQRRKVREKAADSLKMYLQSQMERLGKTKVEGLLATVALQRNPPSVRTFLEPTYTLDTERFVRVIPERVEWDRKALLDAWKEKPESIERIAVVEQTTSLRIR